MQRQCMTQCSVQCTLPCRTPMKEDPPYEADLPDQVNFIKCNKAVAYCSLFPLKLLLMWPVAGMLVSLT